MEILILSAVLIGLLVWNFWRMTRDSDDDIEDTEEDFYDDDTWNRVISEASREYLISTAANQGVNSPESLDNYTLIRLIQKKSASH